MSRLPDFVVIGAQKCGTTTLYADLRSHPKVFIPDKESSGLVDLDVGNQRELATYARLFAPGEAAAAVGEVATTYAMLPRHPEVVSRAKRAMPEAKLVYIVREPVARVVSHHFHEYSRGRMGADIDEAVRQQPALLDNTRYATQLAPWIDAFGLDSVKVVRFESYVRDRTESLNDVLCFLGVGPQPSAAALDQAHNVSDGLPVAVGWRKVLAQSALYRKSIRPFLPESVRTTVTRRVLPRAPDRPLAPRLDTVELIIEQLRSEVEALADITGDEVWWDLDAVLAHHREQR